MLQRVVRLVAEVVDSKLIVVVAAPNQSLPPLPAGILVARDVHEFRGPLQGLATGLSMLAGRGVANPRENVDAVFATGCDVPLLVPAFVDRMFQFLGDDDIAVPFDGRHHHPLAAIYRPALLPQINQLLEAAQMRPRFLFDLVRTREVPVEQLREVDPQLTTLKNLNFDEDYLDALTTAGFTV
jgi:molybdopterin-guanine dinucleotide biosynthesis protein A